MSTLSKDDWKERLAPAFSTSLQAVSERITQSPVVQSWLQEASMEAAEGLEDRSGMQGEMRGYMRIMDALEDQLPTLLAAVNEFTEGLGRVDLHWRPLQPNFSRLYVDFDRDYTVNLFVRLAECTPEGTQKTLDTVASALPEGEPFPNRPNTVTGLVARANTGVGVQVKEFHREDRSVSRSLTLLPPNQTPVENLSTAEATRSLLSLLCSESTGNESTR